mmetsp:Transcript_8190/g.23391  ORF Transcript_8190/g.23391 Transcript_8190/m.23391 type:complete len:208 (-) Transcript_8190:523-1146(-)
MLAPMDGIAGSRWFICPTSPPASRPHRAWRWTARWMDWRAFEASSRRHHARTHVVVVGPAWGARRNRNRNVLLPCPPFEGSTQLFSAQPWIDKTKFNRLKRRNKGSQEEVKRWSPAVLVLVAVASHETAPHYLLSLFSPGLMYIIICLPCMLGLPSTCPAPSTSSRNLSSSSLPLSLYAMSLPLNTTVILTLFPLPKNCKHFFSRTL